MNTEGQKLVAFVGSERFYPLNDKWLPSVTTILASTFPKSKYLIDWQIENGKDEAERILKEAAEEGHIIHSYVEQLIKGASLNSEVMTDKQRRCVNAFLNWVRDAKPKFIATEQKTYCEEKGFAGTIDIIAEVNGEPWIIDVKTSNAVHESHHAQVGGYAYSYSSYMTTTGQLKAAILHINSKTKQGYSWNKVDVAWAWKMFDLCREMFYHQNPDPQPKLIEYPLIFKLDQHAK